MKKQEPLSPPALGGSSLLVIFGVLCLVILCLLSLNTVLAEQRLAESLAQTTADWYAADLQAQEIYARLRAGETVDGVVRQDNEYTYAVPISAHQTLAVTLQKTDSSLEVLSWQALAHPEDGDTTLPVWRGPK